MARSHYVCSVCRQNFTRIWNANRHRLIQHQGLAEIIDTEDFLLKEKSHFNRYSENSKLSSNKHEQLLISKDNTATHQDEETLLTDTLTKLAPKVEELDRLLLHRYTEELKQKIQGGLIMDAIASRDPIYAIDQSIKSIQMVVASDKMINYAAVYLGLPNVAAKKVLQQLLYLSHKTKINRIER